MLLDAPPGKFLVEQFNFYENEYRTPLFSAIAQGRKLSSLINDESFRCTLLVTFPFVSVEALAYPELKTEMCL